MEISFSKKVLTLVPYVVAGLTLGYLFIGYSWQIAIQLVSGPILLLFFFVKPEYGLYLFFFAIIMMTDSVLPGAEGTLTIQDVDVVEGLPPLLLMFLLMMCSIYFFKIYFFKRESPVISFKYLFIFLGILLLSIITGIRHGWGSLELREDFMKMFFPVLCFYLCINVLNSRDKIQRVLWIIFIACLVKSTILDISYLTGHGVPFRSSELGEYQIVSCDSADLMAFVTMILLAYTLTVSRTVTGGRLFFLVLGTIPMIFAVIFSFRRGHWIGMLASVLFLFLWSFPFERKKLLKSLFGISLIVFLSISAFYFYGISGHSAGGESDAPLILTRFLSMFDPEQGSNKHHFLETQQVLQDILKTPFLGLGFGSHHAPVGDIDWADQPTHIVHDTWLLIWMKMGLPGLLFFLWVSFRYLREIIVYRNTYRIGSEWPIVLALASTVGLWMAMFLTGPVTWYYHQTFLIALFSAIVISLVRLERLENKHKKIYPQRVRVD